MYTTIFAKDIASAQATSQPYDHHVLVSVNVWMGERHGHESRLTISQVSDESTKGLDILIAALADMRDRLIEAGAKQEVNSG